MIERKRIHTLFDMIRCSKWSRIFEDTGLMSFQDSDPTASNIRDYKNLVLRDNIFKVSHLRNMEATMKKINVVSATLQHHIEHECSQCNYNDEKCKHCQLNYKRYDIENISFCPFCQIRGHKKCIQEHIKKEHAK